MELVSYSSTKITKKGTGLSQRVQIYKPVFKT